MNKKNQVKLCDFGWSAKLTNQRKTFCGTYEYMAPEIFQNKFYDHRVDIWGLGILLYELFHNYSPFKGQTVFEVFSNIKNKRIKFKSNMNKDAKDLILLILQLNPNQRPSIQQILDHKFLTNFFGSRRTSKNKNSISKSSKNKSFSHIKQKSQKRMLNKKANSIDQYTNIRRNQTKKIYQNICKSKLKLFKSLSPLTQSAKKIQDKFFIKNKLSQDKNLLKKYFSQKCKQNNENNNTNIDTTQKKKFFEFFKSFSKLKFKQTKQKLENQKLHKQMTNKKKFKTPLIHKKSFDNSKNLYYKKNQSMNKNQFKTYNNSLYMQSFNQDQLNNQSSKRVNINLKNQKLLLRKLMQKNLKLLDQSRRKKQTCFEKIPHFFYSKINSQKKVLSPVQSNQNLQVKFYQLIFFNSKYTQIITQLSQPD